jgi:Carboxypeptidase regulatory-like domain/TonB dependent receptor
MFRRSLRHLGTALTLLVAFVCQETWTLASVTGGLTGTVVDAETLAPVAGAQVTAASPSQSATTTTDAAGHFNFLTLAPDTYTVTASKAAYQATSVPGQVVFADTVQSVAIRMPKALRTIAHVTAAAAGSLVKSGTTADVYSINSTTQQAAAALGGGGSLNQAYSAIATVPGAYVIPNQSGYYETINIRGGDYDQVGYEFDGIPVNRSFDNYASSSASSLGNAEVQVYTGAPPANSQGNGLAGYINQVIKSGTYPGYATGSLGIGAPAFYHRAAVEVGGSTPDRLFSYYFGIAGLNQSYNYVNNNNASEYDNWLSYPLGMISGPSALPYAPGWSYYYGNPGLLQKGGPTGILFPMGPADWSLFSWIASRDTVANFHIGIPHHNDAGRDDVQLLYFDESLKNQFYISANDVASPQCTGAYALSAVACANYINGETASTELYGHIVPYGTSLPITYLNSLTWSCPSAVGHSFSSSSINSMASCVTNYGWPNGVNVGSYSNPSTLGPDDRDNSYNDTAIAKIQYTKNFGSNAFLRFYGYTYYSDWFVAGAYSASFCTFYCPLAPAYQLDTHTRGLAMQFSDQLNEQNLLTFTGNYTTAGVVRDNNAYFDVPTETAAPIVSSANPYSGICYGTIPAGFPHAGSFGPVDCYTTQWNGLTGKKIAYGGLTFPDVGTAPSLTGLSCGGAPCEYLLAENGLNGEYSATTPNFYAASLTDEYRPSEKWLLNLGVRLDNFGFVGQNTLVPPLGVGGTEARAFWFTAYNLDNCINFKTGIPISNPGGPGAACPAGYTAANLSNAPANYVYNVWQPRVSGTYTASPDDVFRFSFGRYPEPPPTAFEQYNTRQEDIADYLGPIFSPYGRYSPGYPIGPEISLNYDLSWEHHFKGTDWSFKFTPFLRQTQDQVQEFFLDPIEEFVSGVNVGDQRSQGVEFQLQKGDFTRNGFSGLLSFAYTNSYITYDAIAGADGRTVLTGVNAGIAQYNAYTKACALNPSNPNCGSTSNNMTANACYTPTGMPVAPSASGACPSGDISNPYWDEPIQALINPKGQFPTYDTFPANGIGLVSQGYNSPYVATMLVNYKYNRVAVTPSFQFQGGGKYGTPIANAGIDPAAGCEPLAGTTRYNALTCAGTIDTPDPYTGAFDGIGAFTQPNEFIANVQASYDLTPRIQLVGVVANIVNYCWGGTKTPWTFNDGNICAYTNVLGTVYPVMPYGTPGAVVNPPGYNGSIVQPFRKYPYEPSFGPAIVSAENYSIKTPLQFYLTANLKI